MYQTRLVKDTPADPGQLRSVDVTGRQRPAVPRRQRDADRRRQAHADGQGVVNDVVLLCRSGTLQAAVDRYNRMTIPNAQAPARTSIRQRWGAFLLQTGRTRLTTAQARSIRRRSTMDELGELSDHELTMIGFTI